MRVTVVTVDFDGTLYKGNSFKAMFQMAQKEFTMKEWLIVGIGTMKSVFTGLFKGKEAFRKQFFLSFARSFKGKTKEEMHVFFQHLVEIGKKDINEELIVKIREHEQAGDEVIIVSGALHPFLKAFTKEVGLNVPIISTEILYDENGVCTGEIKQFINGMQKVEHVQAWLDKAKVKGEGASIEHVWAYADSKSDLPLFQFATHPIVVNPNKEMQTVAEQNEWPVFGK